MQNIPAFIHVAFMATTLLTCIFYYLASGRQRFFLYVTALWLLLQGYVASTGFYTVTDTLPPRFMLLIGPPLLLIAALFIFRNGLVYIDSLDAKYLTLLHIVRVPVELILFGLFTYKTIPQIMTFEGNNLDILSGITAVPVYYFGYVKKKFSRTVLILWNIICVGLLINIVSIAVLSAPFPFQQLAFEQPNVAVLYFPFVWLPCCVVPLVLFSHLAVIRQLLRSK